MSIIGEIAITRAKLEKLLLLDEWFVNNNYPMQWQDTFKLINRRIRQGQSFEYFEHWYLQHPRKNHIQYKCMTWPKNIVAYWDECFTQQRNKSEGLKML